MSYLHKVGTSIVWIATFLAAITYLPGLPPNIETHPYSFEPPVALTKEKNDRLNGGEKLFEGQIKGPESFDSYDGVLYTTLHGGSVSKLVGDKLVEVVKFGKPCDGIWEEEKCGRPLGLKFDKHGALYVVDAYYGIFKVNVKTGSYERIIDITKPIDGKRPMTPNSIDVASNGDLYWTDSSSQFKLYDGVFTILADPSGRVFRYNAATKKNEVLLDDLLFANGIKLSDDESFFIVSDLGKSRLIKYYLKGQKAGNHEIFIESLPGIPDNIHSDGNGNFLVAFPVSADEDHPLLWQSLAPHVSLRKMILRLLGVLEAPFRFLEQYYPNYYGKRVIHYLGHFESMGVLYEDSAAVLRIDGNGKVLDVLEANDGKMGSFSSAFIHGDYLYLGSYSNDYLARVPINKALPGYKRIVKQVPTTPKPVKQATTARPTTTTPRPTTTEKPRTTTEKPRKIEKPVTTTEKPRTTTQKPTTTARPITTTQAPPAQDKPKEQVRKQEENIQSNVKPVREESNKKTNALPKDEM